MRVASRTVRWTAGSGSMILASSILVLVPPTAQCQVDTTKAWAFVATRVSSVVSDYIYTGWGYGNGFVMVALLQNPHSGYTESLAGIGLRFRAGANNHQVAVALSRATDASYIQVYDQPTGSFGRIDLSCTFELDLPQTRGGTKQLNVSSGNALARVSRAVLAGITAQGGVAVGSAPQLGVGPAVRFRVPRGEILFAALKGAANYQNEVHATFSTRY